MKAASFAFALMAVASLAEAKGVCSGERECPWTLALAEAKKNWSNCYLESVGVQVHHTDDLNAATEAAFAACLSEEEALYT